MKHLGLDHLVLTVRSLDTALDFYVGALGMEKRVFGEGRVAIHFADQKFNLHVAGAGTADTVADRPMPGSADFCLRVASVQQAKDDLRAAGIRVVAGPVERTGAQGPLTSIYCRDPDGNLVELAEYAAPVD